MRREHYVFCFGFEGNTAIVDGKLMRAHSHESSLDLAASGLYKQAIASALYAGKDDDLSRILDVFNGRTEAKLRTVDDLRRTFGTFPLPAEVKKVIIV